MNWTFMRQVFLFALLYFVGSLLLDSIIFLLSHIPPKVFNLDALLLALGGAERFLAWPGLLLRRLWPGEITPAFFHVAALVANGLVWGIVLAGLRRFWTQARK
jgi:hypothetical protein